MKALFNIKKLQISKFTEGTNNTYTYGTPIRVPGTVSLTMDVEQSIDPIYADGISYISISGAMNTTGTLENYFIPVQVLKEIYRYIESDAGEIMQTDDQPYDFAMQFACDNEEGEEIYFTYYHVSSTKPGINLQTKEDSTTINPQSVELSATPIAVQIGSTTNYKNIIYSFADSTATNYATYFNAVTVPTITAI